MLKRNQDAVQDQIFRPDRPGSSSDQEGKRRSLTMDPFYISFDVQKAIVDRIRSLPGNDRCCDCDSETGKLGPSALLRHWVHGPSGGQGVPCLSFF